jgi:LysR family transcriptional regulator for metE and metH
VNQLEVRHLLLVAAVADEGSLTRAGEQLNLTQSALSHQLLDIEERLGTPLFHRLNRKMLLTDAGQRVLQSARRILEDLANTEEDLRLYATERRGVIRLTTECYTCYHWLPAVMKQFQKKHPDIEIRIQPEATDRPLEALLEGTLDLAIITCAADADRHRGIAVTPLFQDELLVLTAPSHRLAGRDYVKARDFAEETYLTYATLEENSVYRNVLRPAGIEPQRHVQIRLTEAMIEMVKAGMGVAVLAQWAAAPYLDAGVLAGIPLTSRGYRRQWSGATLGTRPIPGYLQAFLAALAEQSQEASRKVARIGAGRRG